MADKTQETVDTKDQEIVISNPVTKNILDKYDVKSLTQEEFDEREQKVETVSAVNEEQQVTKTTEDVVDITDNDLQILSEAGITEESLEGKTLAEIKQIVVDNTPEQVEKPTQDQPVIISDAMAESLSAKYPFAKNLKGKTIDEVMEIIQNQNSYITSLEQRKPDAVATDTNSNSQKISNTSDTEISKDEVVDLFNLSPEEAQKKINEMIEARGEKVAGKVFDEKIKNYLPNIEKVNAVAIEQEKKLFLSQLSNSLPKGVNSEQVLSDWMKVNKPKLSKSEAQALVANPNLLIKIVSDEYNLKTTSAEKIKNEVDTGQTIKKQTYENLKKALKTNRGNGDVFNFSRKHSSSKDLSKDETVADNPVVDHILDKWEKK